MKKWLKILFSLNSLRKALDFQLFFQATKFNYHPEVLDKLNFKKVLVLAPHPDDDCFGVGGTLAKLSGSGASITIAYLCDGSGGVDSESPQKKDQVLIEIRKKEAKKAGDILKIEEQLFFGYRDGGLASGTAAVKAVSDLIKRVQPDIIFLPSFLDNHPDHRATNEILINALSNLKQENTISSLLRSDPQIWAYEVWTPIPANRIVVINHEIELKQKSMEAHVSQLRSRAYDKAVLGLNQYRAEINNQSGFAEAFFASTFEIYQKLYRKS